MADQPRAPRNRRRNSRTQSADTLTVTVQRLSEEVAGLQRALRSRSVIEQAKGVLMGRLHCTADQAFGQLQQISQQTNTRVVEVAAGLLGLTAPVVTDVDRLAPVPVGADRHPSPRLPLPDQEAARYHLTCAAMSAARTGDETALALRVDGLQHLGVTGVVLAVLEPDGAIRLAGSSGLPRGLISAWQRVPAGLNVAFVQAATGGRALWLSRADADAAGLEQLGSGEFRACLPLRRGAHVFGVALFIWDDVPHLDVSRRAYVAALAAAAGRRLAQLTARDGGRVASPAAHWLEAVLQALPGSFALLCPVTDEWGDVVDWSFDRFSPDMSDAAGRTEEQLAGRRLLELYPHLADSAIMRGYERVLRCGRPFTCDELLPTRQGGVVPVTVRAAKLGDGILVTWQHDEAARRLANRIERIERAVGAGWAQWNLQTGEATWSAATPAILGLGGSPPPLSELHRCVAGEDADAVIRAVREVLDHHRHTVVTVRLGRSPTPARLALEPLLDGRGRLIGVYGAVHSPSQHVENPEAGRERTTTPSSTAVPEQSGAESHLAATARRLRATVDDLHRAQQARAVVEQARGMLAAHLGCSIAEASDHLTDTARRRRLPLIEMAAEVVGVPVPDLPTGIALTEPSFHPERYVGGRPVPPPDAGDTGPAGTEPAASATPPADDELAHVAAAMAAARDADALARTVWAHGLRELGATAVLMGVLEPDGAVRLVGSYGIPDALVNAWLRTPSWVNVAYLRAVATDTPLWITREEAEERGYQLLGDGELRACLPLHEADRIFGVISVLWEKEPTLPPEAPAEVAALAAACGHHLSRILRSGGTGAGAASPAAHWTGTVMSALPANYGLLRPVRDAKGNVVDWRYEACSPETIDVAGRTLEEIVGRSMRDIYPHAEATGVFDLYAAALRTGETLTWGPSEVDIDTPRGTVTVTVTVQASRFGDGVLVHWRRHDRIRDLSRRLDLLERIGDCGWAEWTIGPGDAAWSPTVYEIIRREPGKGPVKLGVLHRYVRTEDEAVLTEAVRSLTRLHRVVDCCFTLQRYGRNSRIRLVAEPVLNSQGSLVVVEAVIQRLTPD